mgnify:FL=1
MKNFTLKCLKNAPLLCATLFTSFALLAFNGCAKQNQIQSTNQSISPFTLAPNNALLDESYPHNTFSTADTNSTDLEYANAPLLHTNALESKLQNAINTINKKAISKDFRAFVKNADNVNLGTNFNANSRANLNKPTLQLPINFNLSAWVARMLQIIGTTNDEALATRTGICGTCMLHSYQIIAEFMHYHNSPPLGGGYFFDAVPNTNPFTSFQNRNPLLYDTLSDIVDYYGRTNLIGHTETFTNTVEVAFASSISMLPQYEWNLIGSASTTREINALLSNIFNVSQPGAMYFTVLMRYVPETRDFRGHAVVTIRASTGFIVIPTNIRGISLNSLRAYTRLATTPQELQDRFTMRLTGSPLNLVGLAFIEVREPFNLPFASALSFQDCGGFGEDRRGNAALPRASTLNQCSSGRCIK